MPHLLVAGTTGSGKSVCINALIASMLFRFTPEELRLVIIDPKMVEMQAYQSLPHLAFPIVTDPKKVLLALRWLIDEMERRYKIFARVGVRNIVGFQRAAEEENTKGTDDADAVECRCLTGSGTQVSRDSGRYSEIKVPREDELQVPDKMPYVVVIIDELADLMQTAPADVESGDRAHHANGTRGRYSCDRRNANTARGRHHRRDQGEYSQPHRISGREQDRQSRHSR